MAECVGWMGKIFGHKFVKMNWTNPNDTCFRCGMPSSGWQ